MDINKEVRVIQDTDYNVTNADRHWISNAASYNAIHYTIKKETVKKGSTNSHKLTVQLFNLINGIQPWFPLKLSTGLIGPWLIIIEQQAIVTCTALNKNNR